MGDGAKTKEQLLQEIERLHNQIDTITVESNKNQLETELKTSEERYRAIFENTAVGIFQTTVDGHVLSANPALAHILGYDSHEELISDVTDVADQFYADSGQRAELLHLLDTHGSVSDYEIQGYRKDRSVFWVSMNARVVSREREREERRTSYML